MKRVCQRLTIATAGGLRSSVSWAISSRMRVRFCLNWGLSSSQSGTYYLTNLALDWSSRRRRVVVLVTFDRLSLKWIAHGNFRVREHRDRAPESRILLPIISETLQIRFQSAFPAAPLTKVDSDGLVQQLIDRTAFDFAEIFQRVTLLSFNSQSESSSAHFNSLRRWRC